MKRTIAATVAAVAFASAIPAHAADFILNSTAANNALSPHFYLTFQDATSVSAILGNNPGATSFTDNYYFAPTLASSVGSGSAVTQLVAQLGFGTPGLTITGYKFANDPKGTGPGSVFASLLDAFTTTSTASYTSDAATIAAYVSGAVADYSQTGTSPDPLSRQLSSVPLTSADFYKITITGTGNIPGSVYSGNLSATSVPEPATWAMMLAGFGFIGFAMRRRRQSHPQVRFAF